MKTSITLVLLTAILVPNLSSSTHLFAKRRQRHVGHIFDAFFGVPSEYASRNDNYHRYPSLFDFIPRIDVNVNRHGWHGNRRVNVNVGNGQGVRVGVGNNEHPIFSFGMGPNPGFYENNGDERKDNEDECCCQDCEPQPAPTARPTRKRVHPWYTTPTPRCYYGQPCCKSTSPAPNCCKTATTPAPKNCCKTTSPPDNCCKSTPTSTTTSASTSTGGSSSTGQVTEEHTSEGQVSSTTSEGTTISQSQQPEVAK